MKELISGVQPLISATPLICSCAFLFFFFPFSVPFCAIESKFSIWRIRIKMQSGSRGVLDPCTVKCIWSLTTQPFSLQVAVKNSIDVFYFSTLIPLSVFFVEDGKMGTSTLRTYARSKNSTLLHIELLIEFRINKRVDWLDGTRIEFT